MDSCEISKRGFKKKWLTLPATEGLKWVKYDQEKDSVFCTTCLLVQTSKTGFNDKEKGYIGGKKGILICDLKAHTVSKAHQKALTIISEKTSMQIARENMSVREKERFKRKDNVNVDEFYTHSIRLAYFLARNNLPYSLMDDLCWLIQDVVKISTGKIYENGYGTYTNDQGAKEMVRSVSINIEYETIVRMKKAVYFALSIDESTDISTSKNLVMMSRFDENGIVVTKLLGLVYLESGSADCIVNSIENYFDKNSLSFDNMVGFSSDGASTMTGRINGVAAQLKRKNAMLISTHCAAHKLQLAIQDSTSDFEQFFIAVVKKTSAYFSNSSSRKSELKLCCQDLDQDFYNTLTTVDTRWLSLGNALKNLMKIYTPLWIIFRDDKQSQLAKELLARYETLIFKYWIAFMDDIFHQLNKLSTILQRSDLNVVDLLPKIILSVHQLNYSFITREITTRPVTSSLKIFYQSLPENGITQELVNMHLNCVGFAKRIVENIALRFPEDAQMIIDAMSYLYPRKLQLEGMKDEAKMAIDMLVTHYEALFDTSELEFEYSFWKSFVASNIGLTVTTEEFLFAVFNTQKPLMDSFPTILNILKISNTLAPGSVDCERAFSLQNLVKTKNR